MAWYWWVLIVIAGITILSLIFGGSDSETRRTKAFIRAQEKKVREFADATVAHILGLPIAAAPEPGDIQSSARVSETVRSFYRSPEARIHLVAGDASVSLIRERQRRGGKAVVHRIVRTGHDEWCIRPRLAADFETAIREAQARDMAGVEKPMEMLTCRNCGQMIDFAFPIDASTLVTCPRCGRTVSR